MRMLFAFAGGSGHLEPLVPIARAAKAAGHSVAFAGRPWMVPRLTNSGFEAFVGLVRDRGWKRIWALVRLVYGLRRRTSGSGRAAGCGGGGGCQRKVAVSGADPSSGVRCILVS